MNDRSGVDLAALGPDEKRALLARLLARADRKTETPAAAAAPQRFPLSHAQRRLWFIDRLQVGRGAYVIPAALRIRGALDGERLQRALSAIVARHELLRARFPEHDGEPCAEILPAEPFALMRLEAPAAASTEAALRAEIEDRLRAMVATSFDLAAGRLLRASLLRVDRDDHVLLLGVHHIVADYWSMRVLSREIAAVYAADGAGTLPPLPIQYVDYSVWQRDHTRHLDAQLEYWRTQLASPAPPLVLPCDKARPPVQTSAGMRLTFRVDAGVSAAIRSLARARRVSVFTTLLAAFQALLYRYTGQEDLCVGTIVSNRDRAETRDLIGLFVNNLVLRARLDADLRFGELLQQAHTTALAAFAHQDLPFEQLVDALNVERRLDRHPLFQVIFVLHNTPAAGLELPGLDFKPVEVDTFSTRFDLGLDMVDGDGPLSGTFEFSTELFETATIEGMIASFLALLAAVCDRPDAPLAGLELRPASEPHGSVQYRGPEQAAIPGGVPALLAAARARHADAIAWVWRDERLSYRELHARAGRLMHALRAGGAGPGSRIALCLPRGTDLMVGLLACLRIGAVYVPLDIRQPAERTRQMIADAGVDLALTAGAGLALTAAPDSDLLAALPCPVLDLDRARAEIAARLDSAEDARVGADDLAYVIFTSGTTGRPKGVPITHAALANLLQSMARSPGMAAGDALLAVTTIAFDIAALELLLPLCTGARVVMADAETAQDGGRLGAALDAHRITHLQATPASWRLLIESGWRGRPGLVMLSGGEALDAALARQLLERGRTLWNLYGPTETTIWSAALRVEHALAVNASGALPIGAPIANTWLAVVDGALRPVPPGVAGELLIGGHGLSPGYLERSELTAERFVTIADGNAPLRAYRSGDRVRRRADGLLDFLGRVDHQIKLRGFRIEPGEIEAALNEHASVAQSIVGLWAPGTDHGDAVLVGWYRTRDGHADAGETSTVLMHHLRQRLPTHMLPAALVRITRFPLTPSGKIDRRALPPPEATAPTRAPGRPLEGTVEIRLAEIWNELLPQRVASADDDFFALGGHSLLAARMIARVRAAFDLDPPLRMLFESASLGAFAAQLAAMSGLPAAGAPIPPADRSRELPLSHAQRRQWVLAQLEPNSPLYNIPAAVRIRGQMAIPLLERSLRALGERHEGLRSVFDTRDGAAALRLLPALAPRIEQIDLSADAAAEREAHALACLRAEANRPFDLSRGPLVRVLLVRLDAEESLLLVVLHHILADAASMNVLMRDLSRIYRALRDGPAFSLPPLPLQYADYAAWQLGQDVSAGLAYWREQLAGAPVLLDLPTDYKRPAAQGYAAGSVRLRMSASQRDALRTLARAQGATLFMTLLALFKLFLARYSSSADVVVGTPVGHRPRPELDAVIGLFANTLALRTRLEGCRDFAGVLARVRATALDGFAHQDVAFEQVVEQLNVPRSWAHAPLFQVMFLWQPAAGPRVESFMPVPLDTATTKFDLTLTFAEDADGIAGRLDYRSDLFRPETAGFMADALQALAQAVAFAPERPLVTISLASEQQRRLMRQWNDTASQHDRSRCLHHGFEAQAAVRPEAIALIDGVHRLSYRVLNERADTLARHLRALGIRPEERVGICLERNADLVVALLATLKAGGAYVPLDPAYPPARLRLIMEDAQPRVLLTHHDGGNAELTHSMQAAGLPVLFLDREVAPVAAATSARAATAAPANAAYIIYTSGSTGRPKGVTIEHRQAAALLDWALRSFDADSLQCVLASTSICFDLSVFELFVPLAAGGCVVLARDALHLHELPAAGEVTLINTVPTAAAALLRLGSLPPSVGTVNVAGEPVPHALVQDLYAQPSVRAVYNLYGPSEDTTYSTGARLERPGPRQALMPIPIGRPIANTRAYVLDEAMQPVAIGMTGELYLSGEGVARGYWARPDLTAERFVPNPCADGLDDRSPLAYRTGDRVRFNPDGQLEFLGRIDQQVKIRGFRIETGEVEAALQQHAEVRQAVVGAWLDDAGNKRLAAYVVPEPGADPAGLGARLRGHLQQQLPDFMLPSAFVTLEAVPLLPNGKIDRGRLPRPQAASAGEGTSAPRGDLERRLARIWEGVLQRPCSDVHANFFELGGDSILAIQVVARARQDDIPIAPRDLFQHATIAALAAFASGRQDVAASSREPVRGEVPLTPAQHWFFEQGLAHPQHWNQSLLLDVARPLDEAVLARAVAALIEQHDVLRARFVQEHGVWHQHYVDEDGVRVPPLLAVREASENVAATVARHAEAAQAGLDLADGPLWKMVYFDLSTPGGPVRRLLIVCHHLLIDGVSWRILLDDLRTLYEQLAAGIEPAPGARTASCRDWVQRLQAEYPVFLEELPYWHAQSHGGTALPRDTDGATNRMQDVATLTVALPADETRQLLHALPAAYKVRTEELLLTALALALAPWAGKASVPVMLEGHGREALASELDLTRTLGWLTSFYPVLLPPVADIDTDAAIRAVKTVLRAVPRRGLGYGVLRHLGPATVDADAGDVSTRLRASSEIRFNYLGQADALFPAGGAFSPAAEFTGHARHPEDARDVLFELNAVVIRGELRLAWSYGSAIHRPETIAALAQHWLAELRRLLAHCLSDRSSGGHAPSDFPLMQLDAGELDALLDDL